MLWALIAVSVLLVVVILGNIALTKRVKQLSDEVNYLRAGHDLATRVSYLMHAGRRGEAIALYAKESGMSVADSKHAVEVIAKHNPQI